MKQFLQLVRTARARSEGLIRYAAHVREFLAEPITVEQATDTIATGVRERDVRFLGKLEHSVYAHPPSPYRQLLAAAGCEFGDVAELVRREGLDTTLATLARAGVHLTFEEFKCRTPTVRGSRTFHFSPEDFDDPHFRGAVVSSSGGTRGKPMRFRWSLALSAQWAPHWCVFFAANQRQGKPLIFWTPGNSGAAGPQLACAKFNQRFDHWFIAQDMTNTRDRLYAYCRHLIGRRLAGFPKARKVAYHNTEPVLACVVDVLDSAGTVSVSTTPSTAVRLSLAAQAAGRSLDGVTFLLGAEPLTAARRVTIEASGAGAIPLYGSTEAVWTGGQCPHAQHADEVHVLRDLHAVITAPSAPDPGAREEDEPPALLYTSIAPLTSKILINTDIGDRGVIAERRCDCLYDQLGCRQTIHTIRSSDKITEFGVTFQVPDVFYVLEEILPRRFGARTGDFQLVEERDDQGLPRYTLRIRPEASGAEPDRVREAFLSELGKRRSYYGFMVEIWRKEGIVRAERNVPLVSRRGKILPFHRASG